jgi:hypothetical protein
VEEGHMPLPAYTLVHADATLTQEQIKEIKEWVNTERRRLAQNQ